MVTGVPKALVIILLLALAACATAEPQPATVPAAAYPPAPQPSPVAATLEPTPPATPLPSPSSMPPSSEPGTPPLRFAQLQMFGAETGWALISAPFIRPETSQIVRTVDGVQAWKDVSPPVAENNASIRAAFFIDVDTAVMVASISAAPGSPDSDIVAWRTTDGGEMWVAGEPLRVAGAPGFYPGELFFIDPQHGWLLGASDAGMGNQRVHFFETRDGGTHWEAVYNSDDHLADTDTLWIKGFYPYVGHFTFANEKADFFSDGRLLNTQDGGASWAAHPLAPPADLPGSGCQSGDCPTLVSTSAPRFTSAQDGGLMSRVFENSPATLDVFVTYPNTQNRPPFPTAQYLHFSQDGGRTWAPRPAPVKLGTAYFLDASTGWLLGKSDPDPAVLVQLYQTNDAGQTWTQLAADSPLPLGSTLQFSDAQTGFAFLPIATADYYRDFDLHVDDDLQTSSLYYTQDGGRSWMKVEPEVAR